METDAPKTWKDRFTHIAQRTATVTGTPSAFIVASSIVVVWAISGPFFKYSDTWQLVINTGTTVVTFLMVFMIQNSQNRDSKALHLKLDELIRGVAGARNHLIDLGSMSDTELADLELEFKSLRVKQTTETTQISSEGPGESSTTLTTRKTEQIIEGTSSE